MECPFCNEDFNDGALVCKSCGRDLRLVRPLIDENAELIRSIEDIKIKVSRLRAAHSRKTAPFKFWSMHLAVYVLAPIVLLMAAHYGTTVLMNIPMLYLRLLSIVIPIPFGFALLWFSHQGIRWALSYGALVGLGSVAGMLTVVGLIDDIPIVPENTREWREAMEYVVSIGLALITGHVLGSLLQRLLPRTLNASTAPGPAAMILARVAGGHVGGAALRRRAQKISDNFGTIGTGLGALGTAGGSLYAGFKVLMGG